MEPLLKRIEELEQRCRFAEQTDKQWRAIALSVVALMAAALACTAQQSPAPSAQTLECERLIVKQGGKMLAEIGGRDGTAELALFDQTGNARVLIGVNKEGAPSMSLLNAKGEAQVETALANNGEAHTRISTADRGSLVWTGVEPLGSVTCTVRGKDKRSVGINIDTQQTPSVLLTDSKGHRRGNFYLDGEGNACQIFYHKGGEEGAATMVMADGTVSQLARAADRKSAMMTNLDADGHATCTVLHGQKPALIWESKQ